MDRRYQTRITVKNKKHQNQTVEGVKKIRSKTKKSEFNRKTYEKIRSKIEFSHFGPYFCHDRKVFMKVFLWQLLFS